MVKKAIHIEMIEFKKILFFVTLSIPITIQQRPNKDFLEAVVKEFQMKSPHFVSPSINHGFALAKNTMAKNQLIKITTQIPNNIAPSSSILLDTIDIKECLGGASKGGTLGNSQIFYFISNIPNKVVFQT